MYAGSIYSMSGWQEISYICEVLYPYFFCERSGRFCMFSGVAMDLALHTQLNVGSDDNRRNLC